MTVDGVAAVRQQVAQAEPKRAEQEKVAEKEQGASRNEEAAVVNLSSRPPEEAQ